MIKNKSQIEVFSLLILNILISILFKNHVDLENLSLFIIFFNFLIIALFIIPLFQSSKKIKLLLFIFFIIRLIVLFIDYYIAPSAILHSVSDTERFHFFAIKLMNSNNPSLEVQYTFYTNFLAFFYKV